MTWTPEADGSYTYGVADYTVRFLRPRLAAGGVHSGVWADVSVGKAGRLVHEARYNLSSLSSRREMAKYLASRGTLPEGHDWNGVLESACTRMCREMRRGKEAVDLSTLEDPGEPTYALEKIVLENQITIGFGNGESGKSLWACTLAYAVATGSYILGLAPKRMSVHYLDWETDKTETRRRLQRLAWGEGHDQVPPVHYLAMDRPLADDTETLRHITDGLVIVDSLAPACGGDVMKGEGPQLFWTACRTLKACSLFIVAQTQKDEKTKHTIYGSGMFHYMGRSVWQIRGVQDENVVHVALLHEKANMGRKFAPLAWRFDFDDAARTLRVSGERPGDVGEIRDRLPLKAQIADALVGGARSVADIAAELETTEGTVRTQLNRHHQTFVKVGNEWGLLQRTS